jgi:Sodium/hydrogen exchanger family
MHEDSVVIAIIGIVELLLFASLSAVLLRRIRLPYTIGLMIIGIFLGVAQDRLGMLEPIRHIRLPPDIVLFLFVPTLVFPAAVQLDLRLLRQNLWPLLLLSFPGVILSTAIVGDRARLHRLCHRRGPLGAPGRRLWLHPSPEQIHEDRPDRLASSGYRLLGWGLAWRSAFGAGVQPAPRLRAAAATHHRSDGWCRALYPAGSRYDGRASDSVR